MNVVHQLVRDVLLGESLEGKAAAIPLPINKEKAVSLAEMCMLLGVMIAFATLIVKVVEVARNKQE